MADVVAIADVGELQPAQAAKTLLKRKEIGERLARMVTVGKRVNHRNRGVLSKRVDGLLRERPRNDPVNPAFETSCHVRNGFALTQFCFGMVEKNGRTAEA